MRKIILAFLYLVFISNLYSQNIKSSSYFLNTKNVDFSIKGYYRLMAYNRQVSNLFGDTLNSNVFRLDDEFNSPTLNLEMILNSKKSGYIKTQLYLFEPFTDISLDKNFLKLNRRGISIELGSKTNFGNFKIITGGINFIRFSDFTLSSAKQVRNSLFDRNAWTYVWPINTQFSNYMQKSDYTRAADFGKRQVSGIHFKASELPKQMGLDIFYGKTPFNISAYDNILAFKINRDYKLNHFSVGYLTSNGLDAFSNGYQFKNQIFNSTYSGNINEWKIKGEIAASNYNFESNNTSGNGIASEISIKPSSKYLKFPVIIEGYYISPNFVNIHSSIVNGSVAAFSSQSNSFNGEGIPDGARPFGGVMTPIHIKSNNRYGLNVNSEFNIGKIKVNLGNGISREIQNDTNLVSFFHKVNGLYLSRIERFQSATGSQNNLTTFFRGYYENVFIDNSTNNQIKKSYNVLLLNLKYQSKVFNKKLFVFYLGEFQSLQSFISPIPIFSQKAILRNQFHELDLYLEINKRMSLTGYFGREFIKGNTSSGLGDVLDSESNFNPREGKGKVLGVGLDYSISSNSCFYLRLKKVSYVDNNFSNNLYSGYESTLELKMFF
tara:strand:+ start:3933 stop:5750 length:1818 start_codon:yes stop_codon:yes gene_type:complete